MSQTMIPTEAIILKHNHESLLCECLKVLKFPANPIGKTAEVLVCSNGTGFDTGISNGDGFEAFVESFRPVLTFKNFMGQIIEAIAELDIRANGRITDTVKLTLGITKVDGWPESRIAAWKAIWFFKIVDEGPMKKLVAVGKVGFENSIIKFNIMENESEIIFRILD